MRKIREILRLKYGEGRTHREIGRAVRVSASTVGDVALRFAASGLEWPQAGIFSNEELETALYASKRCGIQSRKVQPDWREVHTELKAPDMTLALLWSEYKALHQSRAYEYSWFCSVYAAWKRGLCSSMRQVHTFGEKCFVDFAGRTVPIVHPDTGAVTQAQIFVGVLGASNYTYVEAVASQNVGCWIGAHNRMLSFFGGTPKVVVPDNLKSGVTKPNFYEPELNPTYSKWAEHYEVAVLPARVRRPKDKAKVEVAVQVVQRWILAALRKRVFYSLGELNVAIRQLLDVLNRKPVRNLRGHREQLFREREQPLLRPLPREPFSEGVWSKDVTVPPHYHLAVDGRLYSVPHGLTGKKVQTRLSPSCVEVYRDGIRVASHLRQFVSGPPVTIEEHMPTAHRTVANWTPQRMLTWASEIGDSVRAFCAEVMQRARHPEQGIRACLGIINLTKTHPYSAVNAACLKALRIRSFRYASVKSILTCRLQERTGPELLPPMAFEDHENIRGAAYYQNLEGHRAAATDY